jgi:hypothetical protein
MQHALLLSNTTVLFTYKTLSKDGVAVDNVA